MKDQLSIIDQTTEKLFKNNTLHITYENEKVELLIEEIFDFKKYDEFIGITYSVTPSFINAYISKFNKVEIVVGIQNDSIQKNINELAKNLVEEVSNLLNNEPIKLYQNLSLDSKEKLSKKEIIVKVPLLYSIHSKFYLLRNSTTGDNRIIIGSANLTEHAFDKRRNQFENIIIFDNSSLYDLYNKYYQEDLKNVLHDYFPKELLMINDKKLKTNKIEDFDGENLVYLSKEEIDTIKEKGILDKFQLIENKVAIGEIPKEIKEEIKNISIDRSLTRKELEQEIKVENIAYSIVKESINTRSKEVKIKSKDSIKKVIKENIKPLKLKVHSNSLDRQLLLNQPEIRNISNNNSGLLVQSRLDKDKLISFGEKATNEEIKNSLLKIHRFIETFNKYVFKYDDEYGQRIFEAILYSFTSPFLFEIKKLSRTSEERHDIPQFLFIGGVAGSGKSSLLKMLSKMLGIDDKPYWIYSELASGARAKSGRVEVLNAWVSENNVYPVFVDEISIDFFSQPNYGRELILNTTNNKVDIVDPFPTVIGTTNADGYSLPAEAIRRSYYLKIDKVFNEEYREESPLEYANIYTEMNNVLFKDFVLEMASKLNNWEDYDWNHFGEKGRKVDFLFETREIFKHYYELAQMPLPRYFPTDRYSDDFETNQEKWRKLYKGTSNADFKFDEVSGNIFFKTTSIDEYSTKIYGKQESEVYKQALPTYVVHGSLSGIDIELDTVEFFKWLDIENPYKDYYKEKLLDFYNKNKDNIETTKEELLLNMNSITADKNIQMKIIECIPADVLVSIEDTIIRTNKEKFFSWMGIIYKKSLFEKIFS